MREMSFGEFTRGALVRDLPLRVRIPADYVARDDPPAQTYWTSPADAAALDADPDHTLRDGFYSVTVSLNVGYDAAGDRFFGVDGDDTTMKAAFEAQGYAGVSLERHRVNGVPALFLEAEKDGRRSMIVYLALLVDTNAVFAYYSHPVPLRQVDRDRWHELKAAILASPPI
jgi:hypothetical protein